MRLEFKVIGEDSPDLKIVRATLNEWGRIDLRGGSLELIPTETVLLQNYPNPFNVRTVIRYGLPFRCRIRLVVYNLEGQEVRELVDGWREGGYYLVTWDGKDENGKNVSTGVYLVRMEAGRFSQVKKIVLLK